jgi:Methyltransferase FkbM domain
MSLNDRFFAYINFFMNYIQFLKLYKSRYRNYVSILYHVLRNIYPVKAVFNSGETILLKDYQEVFNNLNELDVDPCEDVVYFDELKFYGGKTNGDILHVFKMNEYSFLPVEDKEVIDIGANIGDSSIYFASRGASKVIALEPDKINFDYALKNITSNGFSKIINTLWAGCGSNDISSAGERPEILTLKTLVEKYCSCPQILKIDCEGCEYDLILNASSDDLKRFTHIQIEYHFGYQNLKTKLEECGFEVRRTRPTYFIPMNKNRTSRLVLGNEIVQSKKWIIGNLYATRIR